MYFIRKYADCWAVHNDDTGRSRPLTEDEKALLLEEFKGDQDGYMRLLDDRVLTFFVDRIASIKDLP
jgi:hypothetical protein